MHTYTHRDIHTHTYTHTHPHTHTHAYIHTHTYIHYTPTLCQWLHGDWQGRWGGGGTLITGRVLWEIRRDMMWSKVMDIPLRFQFTGACAVMPAIPSVAKLLYKQSIDQYWTHNSRSIYQRWQQVIFCKFKSSHKSFPCKSKSSHKSFPCKSKSSHKSFGQTSSQVTSHLVQTQVKSQVSLSKYKSSRTLFLPLPS